MTRRDLGQHAVAQLGAHHVRIGLFPVDVRVDGDRQPPVRVPQRLETAPVVEIDHRHQRDAVAAGQEDAEVLEAGKAMTLAVGQHDADLDLLVALVEDLHEFAVEGAAQLAADLAHAQPQRLSERVDVEHQLLLAVGHVVLDRLDARHLAQRIGQRQRRLFQRLGVRAGQLHLQVPSRVPARARRDGQVLEPGGPGQARLPGRDEILVTDLAPVRRDQLDGHRRELVTGLGAPAVREVGPAVGDVGDPDQAAAQFRLGLVQGLLDLGDVGLDPVGRRAGHVAHARDHDVALDVREEAEAEATTGEQADEDDHARKRRRDHRQPVVHGPVDHGPEAAVAEAVEAGVPALAEAARPGVPHAAEALAQVAGQDQEALDQRRDDHADDDQRDVAEDVADEAGDREQRDKCRDRGQR